MQSFYRVDAEDQIIEIGGDWDRFALQNGGENAVSERMIGTRLFDSISGDSSKMYADILLRKARVIGTALAVDYYCNSPNEHRHARMKMTGEADGVVLVAHRFLSLHRISENPDGTVLIAPSRWIAPLKQCLDCKRVQIEDGWVVPEDVPSREGQQYFRGFCEDCLPVSLVASA